MIDHLSHSSVAAYLRCPRQWAYRYLERLPVRRTASLIRGSAVDHAASFNLAQKLDSHVDLPVPLVCEAAEDALREQVDAAGGRDEVEWEGGSWPRTLDSTIELTRVHMAQHAPWIQPIAVQERLERTLPSGLRFVGIIDYRTEDVVGDVKTGSRRMGQEAADTDLQPSAYAFLLGGPIQFEFARVIDTGTRRYDELVTTRRGEDAIAWYADLVTEVERGIAAGVFPPNPQGWWCSERQCPFWTRCMVERRPPEVPDIRLSPAPQPEAATTQGGTQTAEED